MSEYKTFFLNLSDYEKYMAQFHLSDRPMLEVIEIQAVKDLQEKLEIAETALDVYSMTNETFPEYGDVAREALQKIRGNK